MNFSSLKPVSKYYNEYFRSFRMNAHQHKDDEIMYVVEGMCRVPCFDSEAGIWTEYLLSEGNYIHIRGGIMHNLLVEHNSPCRILNLEYTANDQTVKLAAPWSFIVDDGSFFHILRVVHDILDEWDSGYYTDKVSAERDLELSLALLERKIALQQNRHPVPDDFASQYVAKAKEFIRAHYSDDLMIADISGHVGVATAYLQRLFKQVSGMTIMEYINDMRFKRSKYLLTHTKLSIADVSENAGFGSRQRLSQIFRDKERCSPGQYRASSYDK